LNLHQLDENHLNWQKIWKKNYWKYNLIVFVCLTSHWIMERVGFMNYTGSILASLFRTCAAHLIGMGHHLVSQC